MLAQDFQDPLDQNEDWFYPTVHGGITIPRNFRLAFEMASVSKSKPDLEFVFFNVVENELIVVEPVESLHLMMITIESEDGLRYVTTAIDLESWVSLKSQLVYLGVV